MTNLLELRKLCVEGLGAELDAGIAEIVDLAGHGE